MNEYSDFKMPFIHLFRTSIGYYFFDVNTDSIVKVSKKTYEKLHNYKEYINDPLITKMMSYGLLQPNKKRYSAHPETECLDDYFKRNLNTLVLQVTQRCNQRCAYCVFSGRYDNRIHNNMRMDFQTAKKGIDMIIAHSMDAESLYFGFYGGEPLLEKGLIQNCIEYLDNKVEGKKIYYNITTNATLLTDDIIPLLVDHKVALLVSLDGPQDVHNKNRGFTNENGNPHGVIMNNLRHLMEKYPEYYQEYVSFNAVLTGTDSFSYIDAFFKDNRLFKNVKVMSSLVSNNYCKNNNKMVNEGFEEELSYATFLNLLKHIGRIKGDTSKLLETQIESIDHRRKDRMYGDQFTLPETMHHTGVCLPGIHKLFMTAEGKFYPCEKISEKSQICRIGDIDNGINIQRVKKLLNIELYTEKECKKCWAYQYCTVCLVNADGLHEISRDKILSECKNVRERVETEFKDYCVCKENKIEYL